MYGDITTQLPERLKQKKKEKKRALIILIAGEVQESLQLGIQMVQSCWKQAEQFLTKLSILLLYHPAIVPVGIYTTHFKITQKPTWKCV